MSETDKPGIKNIVEFALLAAGEPLDIGELRRLTAGEEGDVREALSELEGDWSGRSMRLARAAGGWQLVSREGYAEYLRRLRPKKPPRLSRQLLEVLAVIAYQQPATRGDIEQARGVSVSALHLATLEEFGWIEEVGRRETPGRPGLVWDDQNIFERPGHCLAGRTSQNQSGRPRRRSGRRLRPFPFRKKRRKRGRARKQSAARQRSRKRRRFGIRHPRRFR